MAVDDTAVVWIGEGDVGLEGARVTVAVSWMDIAGGGRKGEFTGWQLRRPPKIVHVQIKMMRFKLPPLRTDVTLAAI